MGTKLLQKLKVVNLSFELGSNGVSGSISEVPFSCDALYVTVNADMALGIRIDDNLGEYFRLASGINYLRIPISSSLNYWVFTDDAFEVSFIFIRGGR
jgi:hypothetical protein